MNLSHKRYNNYSQDEINRAFLDACVQTDLELAQFLLTNHDLRYLADIHTYADNAFRTACKNDNVEVLKFLLFSPKIREHVDVHTQLDIAIKLSIARESFNVLEYLIIELNIPKNRYIEQHLKDNPKSEAIRLFELRNLNKDLNTELSLENIENTNRKLKL
jgi:hypothetical protein